ncbi:hypothetical protein K474DRAFT_878261 [Panus rudis PR-1116 ss-1]|nr:hypothetical protein K474DRAFT_878261 [Panus rudis PR-1116 ss-1]
MSSPNPYTPPYTGANPFLHQTFPLSQSLGPSHPSQAPLAPSSSQVSNLNSRPGHPQLHPEPSFTPATVEPPRKRPRRHLSEEEERLYNLARLSDADAWSYSDIDILAAFETRCESKVYGHFVKSVSRTESGGTRRLTIMLACKHGDPRHLTHARERCKQGSGTSNLVSAVRACDARRQHASQAKDVPGYTLAHHRMLIVIRCARRKRSFRSVQDAEYLEELQLVAQDPTISVPCERTIQRDTERLYEGLAPSLTAYFKVSRD